MAKLRWALTCQRAITDAQTNTISYIDCVEEFIVSSLPFPFPLFQVATLWERDSLRESLKTRLRMIDPNGKELLLYEPKIGKSSSNIRHRINFLVGGMRADSAGRYEIKIQQQKGGTWRTEATLQVDAKLIDKKRVK